MINISRQQLILTAEGRPAWPLFYPRIYRNAERFGDPRLAALSQVVAMEQFRQADANIDAIAQVGFRLAAAKTPTLFVDRAFAEAASRSEPPADLNWSEVKLPFEAAFLILPNNWLRSESDGSCQFIGYARQQLGEIVTHPLTGEKFRPANNGFTIYTGFFDRPPFPMIQRTLNDRTPLIGDAVSPEVSFLSDERFGEGPTAKFLTFAEAKFTERLTALTFSLLLAMTARPSLVRRGQRQGRHKKSGLPIWTPNIIGGGYRYRSEPHKAGAGSSKRMHWRRGHFRRQQVGEGRTETRIIWIEPTLVGGEK